jgi:hypothetical protein
MYVLLLLFTNVLCAIENADVNEACSDAIIILHLDDMRVAANTTVALERTPCKTLCQI